MRYAFLAALIGALASAGMSAANAQGSAADMPVPSPSTITPQQFQALSPDAMIEVDGQRMSKRDFIASRLAAIREERAKMAEARAQAEASFERRRKAFLDQQNAELAQANQKVQAEIDRLRSADAAAHGPNWDARRKQAGDLLAQAAKTLPAERARLEKQASDLLSEKP